MNLGATAREIEQRKREEAVHAGLEALGLKLAVDYGPDGPFFSVTRKDGGGPELRFGTGEELEKFITAETAAPAAASGCRRVKTTPYVGQPVHYRSYGTPGGEYPSVCRAAIVTEVEPGLPVHSTDLGLCVLNPEGQFFNRGVRYDPGTYNGAPREADPYGPGELVTCEEMAYQGGTWHFIAHPEVP